MSLMGVTGGGLSKTEADALYFPLGDGVVDVPAGGTGASTFVANQILYGNGTGAVQSSAKLFWTDASNRLTLGAAGVSARIQAADGSSSAGGSLAILGGAGAGTNQNGGGMSLSGGAATGSGFGGGFSIAGGLSISGTGGALELASGSGGTAGAISITTGASSNGNGAAISLVAGDGGGTNMNGGDVSLQMGSATDAGTKGYFSITNSFGDYTVAAGTGILTAGLGPGTQALTMRVWIPVVADGTLTYIQGWQV